ncbi:type II secretion system F family protein [Candidatus Micrarchaeota archaeon]|nr:type II secretion system F family protein [Candidatus Micrarchaeota archaeon]
MAGIERLDRLRKAIERGAGEREPAGKPREEPKGSALFGDSGQRGQKPLDARAARIRSGVLEMGERTLDFSKLDLARSNDAGVRAIGRVYSVFEAPILKAAQFFSTFPSALELRSTLITAGIGMTVEAYLTVSATAAFISAVLAAVLIVALNAGLAAGTGLPGTAAIALFAAPLVFLLVGASALAYPPIRSRVKANEIDRDLPYALRQLSTQVKAGTSFQKAIASIAQGDYGTLSREFQVLHRDMESGKSTTDALLALHDRTRSKGLRQAVMQVIRALRIGGPLTEIVESIANEVSFETRMRIRDFTEELNLISIILVMVAIVAPVVVTILAAVTQLPLLGWGFGEGMIAIAFGAITLGMVSIIVLIKKLEPLA